jgi:hypothetical protein
MNEAVGRLKRGPGINWHGEIAVANVVTVKTAIESGDAAALHRLLAEDASRANELVSWGKNDRILTHPLHYVCDMLFEGTLARGRELPLIEALIRAGADLDHQPGPKADTPLIGAASLGAEDAGLVLLRAGARPFIGRRCSVKTGWPLG